MAHPKRIKMIQTLHVRLDSGKAKKLIATEIYEDLGALGAKLVRSGMAEKLPLNRRKAKS